MRLKETGHGIGAPVLQVPADLASVLAKANGRLVLGVRPEAVGLSHAAEPGSAPAVVELIEPMGSVNHIMLRLDGAERATIESDALVALVRSNEEFVQGEPTSVTLRPDRLVLFDAESGSRACLPVGPADVAGCLNKKQGRNECPRAQCLPAPRCCAASTHWPPSRKSRASRPATAPSATTNTIRTGSPASSLRTGCGRASHFGRHVGRAAIRAHFARVSSEIVFAAHLVVNPIIDIEFRDKARAKWRLIMPATVVEGGKPTAKWLVGAYDDRYVRVDGVWLFESLNFRINFYTPHLESWASVAVL